MILSKTVIIKIYSKNIKHFESLGYIIPKYIDKLNRLCVKTGTTIEVKVEHLMKGSHVKILVRCDNPNCNHWIGRTPSENWIPYQKHLTTPKYYCLKCANSSPEHLKNLSKSHLGKHLSEISKRKVSENNWMSKHLGKFNPNYNHNLTDKERNQKRIRNGSSTWKRKVKERDQYTCKKCKYIGCKHDGRMVAHHINNYNNFKEQSNNLNNGITLCKDCHESKLCKGIHNLFGKYTTKNDWDNFLLIN